MDSGSEPDDDDDMGTRLGPHFWLEETAENHPAVGDHIRLHVRNSDRFIELLDWESGRDALAAGVSRILRHGDERVVTFSPFSVGLTKGFNGEVSPCLPMSLGGCDLIS